MKSDKREIKARENWIRVYEELGSISKAALKCGIPRSTLYRWIKRVEKEGPEGRKGYSKCPKHLADQKINDDLISLIKSIRKEFKFGPKSINVHLLRNHSLKISTSTVWRVLQKEACPKLKRYRKTREFTRYSKPTFRAKEFSWMLQKLHLNAISLRQ